MTLLRPLLLAAGLLLLPPAAARGQDFEMQLRETLKLIDEGSYSLALEDLRFTARQIQELRLREAAPLFPPAPEGWNAEEPILILPETDLWSRRLRVMRKYLPEGGGGKIELLFDFFSPLIPQASLSLNPVYAAGDSRVQIIETGDERARFLFNADTGEGELLMIPANRLIFTVTGRGIPSGKILRDFASLVDMDELRSFSPR